MDTLDRLLLVLSPSRPPGTWSLHDRRWHTVGLSELHAKCLLGKCANEVWHSEAFSKSKPQSTKLIEFLQKKKKKAGVYFGQASVTSDSAVSGIGSTSS